MSPTPTLADFLLARITEDEAPRKIDGAHEGWCLSPERLDGPDGPCAYCGHEADGTMAEEVPRSARVLAECEAKRRIVELWRQASDPTDAVSPDYFVGLDYLEDALRLLALPYASHPDYRAEWSA